MSKIKILISIGTRPEAIKMAPLIKELKSRHKFNVVVCSTGQQKEMLKQALDYFSIEPEYDLNIMKNHQNLYDITINVMNGLLPIFAIEKPDLVLVHGDTTTTFATSLSAFYSNIPIGHVEAGLRTYDISAPYPEEFNRQAVGIIARFNFAPTENAKLNLLKEGKEEKSIYVTGNTIVDALKYTIQENYYNSNLEWAKNSKLILLTAHRRENMGERLNNIFMAVRKLLDEYNDVKVLYPIHLNPIIREQANVIFKGIDRIRIIEPLSVFDFHNFYPQSYIIMTDSGGIQEEASSLGKPVLVLRDKTERPEGVKSGNLKLVGTEITNIYNNCKKLLDDENYYLGMTINKSVYGEGFASVKIADILESYSK